ncbi:chemotaxis protein CheC [Methanohalophilus levihalophilus]|uniref:chemotaxis protein CheC n=1 Tax=Methanohalophilus levihalophilus TaxID=1431282 RepID=UPI001AE5B763|nr:chemotaxis protein CheC [Methanohalophilus levihalophilus]MBP2029990.1 chemotaxis protein CheC [Methanohalophilus levihalophilus]
MVNMEALGEMEVEVLTELGNIGAGHAATSLSTLLDQQIDITVPKANLVKIADIDKYMSNNIVAGVLMALQDIDGTNSGYLYVMIPEASSNSVVSTLYGTDEVDPEMYSSAVMEVGNILSSSFCDACAEFMDIILLPSPPNYAMDMAIAVVDSMVSTMAESSDHIILFETALSGESNTEVNLLLIPEATLFDDIMKMLEGL